MSRIKKSIILTAFWVLMGISFGLYIYLGMNSELGLQFFSVYLTEYMLSIDNLFVILLIFSYFKVEEQYQQRVLFFGIVGAFLFRLLFITLGFEIVEHFNWVLYLFGVLMIYTGYMVLAEKNEKEKDLDKNKLLKNLKRFLPLADGDHGKKFFVRVNGKLMITTLTLCLLMIEFSDVVFALDSIPASFSISQDKFVIFAANVFALLGLRSLFFLIEYILHKFHLITKALAIILFFIGGKMLIMIFNVHIGSAVSLAVLFGIISSAIILSHIFPKNEMRV